MLSIKTPINCSTSKANQPYLNLLESNNQPPHCFSPNQMSTAWWFQIYQKNESELNWDHYPRSQLLTKNSRANGFDNFQPLWKVVGIIIESSLFILVLPKNINIWRCWNHQASLKPSPPPGTKGSTTASPWDAPLSHHGARNGLELQGMATDHLVTILGRPKYGSPMVPRVAWWLAAKKKAETLVAKPDQTIHPGWKILKPLDLSLSVYLQ